MAEEQKTTLTQPVGDPYPEADSLMKSIMDDYEDPSAPEEAAPSEPSEEVQPAAELEEAEDEGSEDPYGKAIAPKPADAVEVDKARKAARLAGLPESVVEKLSENELLEWHTNHSKNESDVTRAFRERAELQRELDELKATRASEPAVPTDAEDQELAKVLDDMLGVGPEDAKKLAKLIDARMSQPNARVEALEAALEQRLAKSVWSETARDLGLGDEAGGDVPKAVMDAAQALNKTAGPWDSLTGEAKIKALFLASARATNPDAPSDAELRRRAAISRAKKNGTATAAPQRNATPKKPTANEILDAKIEAIRRGETDLTKLRAIGR